MIEEVLRIVSAVGVTAAAVLCTLSWRRWAHSLIKFGMAYSASALWVITIYRWWLVLAHVEPGGEFAEFIRMFVNVGFLALATALGLHALATREYARKYERR